MMVETGQVWEIYSDPQQQWIRVTVEKIDERTATLRYEGVLEFTTVDISEMENSTDRFRPAASASSSQ